MRSFSSRKAIHGRVQARQNVSPAGPVVMPRQDPGYYLATGTGVVTATGLRTMPTATALVFDTTAIQTFPFPASLPHITRTPSSSSTPLPQTTEDTSILSATDYTSTTTALSTGSTVIVLNPAQKVYDGIANSALHSLPPAVIGIASGGSALIVLLALYCYICRWYYRRLPRSTKRWDIDDRAKKEVVYGDKPRYSPSDDELPHMVGEDRRSVPVGDSYFPQGETWQKFEGRTAHHPESFIYTGPGLPEGMESHSLDLPPMSRMPPNSGAGLPRPRPQFANPRRGQIESVFSNVSFPTTHRADSIRHSFFPEGYEHDGEVWDLASPGFVNEAARPSLDSSARSVNRASIFGEASARARGSIVVYEVPMHSPTFPEDPFAGPGVRGHSLTMSSAERSAGKKSFEGYHTRSRSRDVRGLDTLAEDVDESSSQGHGTMSSSSFRFSPRA